MTDIKTERIKILYVDDELENLKAFKASFRRLFDVSICESPAEAIEVLKKDEFEIIISDQRMPDMNGTDFFNTIKSTYPDSMRILLTGYSDLEAVVDAINQGQVYRYVTKPWNETEMVDIVKSAFEVYSLRMENKILTKSLLQANEQLEYLLRQKLLIE